MTPLHDESCSSLSKTFSSQRKKKKRGGGVGLVTRLQFLGITLDTVEMKASDSKEVSEQQMLSLLGNLNFNVLFPKALRSF